MRWKSLVLKVRDEVNVINPQKHAWYQRSAKSKCQICKTSRDQEKLNIYVLHKPQEKIFLLAEEQNNEKIFKYAGHRS